MKIFVKLWGENTQDIKIQKKFRIVFFFLFKGCNGNDLKKRYVRVNKVGLEKSQSEHNTN